MVRIGNLAPDLIRLIMEEWGGWRRWRPLLAKQIQGGGDLSDFFSVEKFPMFLEMNAGRIPGIDPEWMLASRHINGRIQCIQPSSLWIDRCMFPDTRPPPRQQVFPQFEAAWGDDWVIHVQNLAYLDFWLAQTPLRAGAHHPFIGFAAFPILYS